jgi:hypothetical protein
MTADDIAPGFSKDIHEARIIRDAEVADPGIGRRANEAQTRDRGTNGPALTGKMMHRAVAPGPGYSAAIAMPGSCQGAARSPPPRRAAPSSSRGHGQVPNASMDAQSMSTTITSGRMVRAYAAHWSPRQWTTLLPASQRSPAVRFASSCKARQSTDRYRQRVVTLKSHGPLQQTEGSACAGSSRVGRPPRRPRIAGSAHGLWKI